MEIAAIVLGIIADLTKAGIDAYHTSKLDAAAAKKTMLDALDAARRQVELLPSELAADDAEADKALNAKFPDVDTKP